MSPVHIDELTPDVCARVLKEIEETEGVTTALATVEEQSSMTLGDPAKMTSVQSISADFNFALPPKPPTISLKQSNAKCPMFMLVVAIRLRFVTNHLHICRDTYHH